MTTGRSTTSGWTSRREWHLGQRTTMGRGASRATPTRDSVRPQVAWTRRACWRKSWSMRESTPLGTPRSLPAISQSQPGWMRQAGLGLEPRMEPPTVPSSSTHCDRPQKILTASSAVAANAASGSRRAPSRGRGRDSGWMLGSAASQFAPDLDSEGVVDLVARLVDQPDRAGQAQHVDDQRADLGRASSVQPAAQTGGQRVVLQQLAAAEVAPVLVEVDLDHLHAGRG